MPVSGDTLSLPSSESAISKTLNKIFKGSNDTHLDSAIKSAHHSSILNKPLKFKVSEQTNLTSISNLKQLYTPVQNGAVSRNLNFEPKAKKLQQIKKAEKVEDDVPIAKITISQPLEVKLTWSRSHRVGCGLRNLGNSCFMNAVLQCLTYLPPVAYALVEKNHLNQCYVKGFCTLCEVQKHIHRVMTSSDQWVAPSFIFNNLSKIGNFVRHKQEDAHEFLRYLLCHMEKCALDNFKTKHSINIDAASSRTTIINNIFGGYNRSQVICLKCKEKSNTFDPFMDTMLDIKNTESLDGALMKYVQPETLEGDNAYKCSQCKCRVPAQKRVTIHQAPSVCTFHLKRFQYNNAYCCKIGKIIKFPEKLNLRPYMSESKGPPVFYMLRGLVVHAGPSMQSGHYYAYVRNAKGNFYVMNDDLVSHADKNKVLNQPAYILFYCKMPQVQKQNDSSQMNGSSSPSSKENDISHVNKSHKNSNQPRIVIKIKNGRVNSLDENNKCGLVPYPEDSDVGSDQDQNASVNRTEVSVNKVVSTAKLNGHNPMKILESSSSHVVSSVNGITEKSELKQANCVSPVVSSKKTLPQDVESSTGSALSPKKIASLTHPIPHAYSQSPSRLTSSGNWSITENINQEPSVASSTSSANSVISSVDNWTVSDQGKEGHKIEKRTCMGWTISPAKRVTKPEHSTANVESFVKLNNPPNPPNSDHTFREKSSKEISEKCEKTVAESVKKCNKNDNSAVLHSASENIKPSKKNESSPMSESRCDNFRSETKETNTVEPLDNEIDDSVDSDDSDCSYEVEWVERTKETIEQAKELESKEKAGSNNFKISQQDKNSKLHNGYRENKHLEGKHGPQKRPYSHEMFGSSLQSYGSSVKSWNGNTSEVNLEAEREKRLRRWGTDDYNEEFDRGKVDILL
ncbi:Ubiquitin carboxyl-terminal hydrolase 42 [Nymphon striatum]|nr:Ubiquitin carboxyl-terminal hydrolase 42 [Nymphon striatum]